MTPCIRSLIPVILFLIFGVIFINACLAEDDYQVSNPETDSGARFVKIFGDVRVHNPCTSVEGIPATLNTILYIGDYVFTEENSNATIRMPDGLTVLLLNKSELLFGEPQICSSPERTLTPVPTVTIPPILAIPVSTEVQTLTPAPTSVETVKPESHPAEEQNPETGTMYIGEKKDITLSENPTTGYQWEVSVTNGLDIISDSYLTDVHPAGMVGAGGSHVWTIMAVQEGKQKFTAIKRRSWEPVTGDEKSFYQEFIVIPSEEHRTGTTTLPVTPEHIEVSPTITSGPSLSSDGCQWAGSWQTSFNTMTLNQSGDLVSGSYAHNNGKINGTARGKEFMGTWQETTDSAQGEYSGPVQLTMSDDCNSFSGNWKYATSETWNGEWTGKR